jgi:hypothetical protein
MSYANPHYDPDWKALHERHAAERQRAQEELNRLAESGAMMSDAYNTAQAAFRRHNAACLATNNMQHATVQEFAEWLFGSFRVDINDREGGIPVPQVDFATLRTTEEVYAAWTRIHSVVSDAAWERRHRLPVGQPEGLAAFSDTAAPGLTRSWRQFSPQELYPGGYARASGVRTLMTVDAREDGWHVCFMHDAGSPGMSVTNAIELLASAVYRVACAIAEAETPRGRGFARGSVAGGRRGSPRRASIRGGSTSTSTSRRGRARERSSIASRCTSPTARSTIRGGLAIRSSPSSSSRRGSIARSMPRCKPGAGGDLQQVAENDFGAPDKFDLLDPTASGWSGARGADEQTGGCSAT